MMRVNHEFFSKFYGIWQPGAIVLLLVVVASAEDRGFKFNNLNISPYVNMEYRYNSNVDNDKNDYADNILSVTPGVDLQYAGNNWGLQGGLFYGYDRYVKYDELDSRRWGENLKAWWESEKGWRLVLGESYVQSKESDSIIDGGRGIWRDREQLQFQGALSYQMERTGVTLSASYSDLDYHNDTKQYAPLYGWTEWSTGLEFARKLTEKTNLLLAGGIQGYESDGVTQRGLSNQSTGYTIQGGLGSRATERINYRLLAGASWFDYGNEDMMSGWTYSADVNWLITKKWALSVAGSSYYQPSETEANQGQKIYMLSSGVTYRPFKKLSSHFDLAWRRESDERESKYGTDEDTASARLRADYNLMRFATVYAGVEYTKRFSDEDAYEYDRFLGTVGLRLFY